MPCMPVGHAKNSPRYSLANFLECQSSKWDLGLLKKAILNSDVCQESSPPVLRYSSSWPQGLTILARY